METIIGYSSVEEFINTVDRESVKGVELSNTPEGVDDLYNNMVVEIDGEEYTPYEKGGRFYLICYERMNDVERMQFFFR